MTGWLVLLSVLFSLRAGLVCLPLLAAFVLAAFAMACHADARPESARATGSQSLLIRNGRLPGGGAVDVLVVDGLIVEVGAKLNAQADNVIDAQSKFLVPGVIDSHVHLEYLPVADKLAAEGIAAAVDLAAPLPLRQSPRDLDIVSAGPMLAALA